MNEHHYDVLIIGGGISGCALAYELARYTDIEKIAVVEKYGSIATLNSKGTANSQTIHVGDIETNYTLAKAAITKRTAKMVEKYCLQYGYQNSIIFSHQKMALGIGDEEVEFLLNRYEEFSELFPYLEVWDKEELKTIEPRVVLDEMGNERPERIVAIGAKGQWTTVDYGKMALSFITNAQKEEGKTVDLFVNSPVTTIKKNPLRGYSIQTKDTLYSADFVVVNAGAHSLYLAHSIGHGLDYSCLPVAGSFYLTSQQILNGKVYMIQNPKLPFAALHGDPDILADGNTRFGPTALVLPKLERFTGGTYLDFWKTLRLDLNVVKALWKLLRESDIRNYIFRNFLFEVPYFNKRLFLHDARKIVPSLRLDEFEYAHGFGGVRPQVIDKKQQKLMLGEASINTGEGIIFNMTPSPGATSCLGNGERDMRYVVQYLGKTFDEKRFNDELTDGEYCVLSSAIEAQKQTVNAIREAMVAHEKEYYEEIHVGKPHESFWSRPHSLWKRK
jgi:malate dehydrogenase (quinone)